MNSTNIYEKCDPDAASTIESLRRLNYDLGVAAADIIDNSISAGATKIKIIYKWDLYKIQKLIYNLNEIELLVKKNFNNSINFITDFILQETSSTNN